MSHNKQHLRLWLLILFSAVIEDLFFTIATATSTSQKAFCGRPYQHLNECRFIFLL